MLIGAELVYAEDELLLVTRKAQANRFQADDAQLRPMGRATCGEIGMRFREGDGCSRSQGPGRGGGGGGRSVRVHVADGGGGCAEDDQAVTGCRARGGGGLGIEAMRLLDARGSLVGAIVVSNGDQVLCVKASGQVTRSPAKDLPGQGP